MKEYLQHMGKSLMLPVATLPVAAIFMGIGYWIDPTGWGANSFIAAFLIKGGSAILDNLGLLFAIGIAIGMANDKEGSASLSGVVAFLVPITLLNTNAIAMFQSIPVEDVNIAFSKIDNGNVFLGIVAGAVSSMLYNRYAQVKLPMALSFFSGRRLIPILSALFMLGFSFIMIYIWPLVFDNLVGLGKFISALGPLGAGLYGFFNRLLIPTGLHHALNNVFWFNLANINDIGNFWSNAGVKGITGMYQAGFFPIMMFGLPGGALAIYHAAHPSNKKTVASLMIAASFASFFTGVTEPLEFSFMFVAWPLYLFHALLTGLSLFIAATMHWTAGFNFSAGLIDFVLSLRVPIANHPFMLLGLGICMFFLYYISFSIAIRKFNLLTPGREDEESTTQNDATQNSTSDALALDLYTLLGGLENIVRIANCTTRLRITVKSTNSINIDEVKKLNVLGVRIISETSIQIIIGTEVQFIADALNAIYDKAKSSL
ncbi:N-acetylglucosamine-specific PTS transporter subunit IIBC [Entomospira entomophila]|uniref:PTS transporter subunit EIIC n=1 Tax=Entomospira entomophila TaxID=2719988 RepID=A0A968KRU1_9SPIO|nr:N-acetylglucosamine-specific PTS transporter subunit IIBC [Entomospira entomophilus]NIZ41069.1 PTS transporter subunit EIIC [Entomospira entomophilus]WDI35278.1 N-acetylglucosamine-specific PTS transporter subunit IIBC [Entomospira entomophilus]